MRAPSVLLAIPAAASLAAAQNVVSIGIAKPSNAAAPIHRRASTYTETLINNITGQAYYATLTVGTPAQNLTLVVDTGSSDMWVLDSAADLCTSARLQEEYYGGCVSTYDPSKSSTYSLVSSSTFEIQYVDGSGAEGDYIKDDVSIGGANVKSLQMGLAKKSVINSGLIGIGYEANEASQTEYPNIISLMVSQGLIGIKAYSLYLDDLQSSTGTILFGGVDTKKYLGSLIAVPIEPDSRTGTVSSFTVALSSFSTTYANGTSTNFTRQAVPVILDSGTTLTYLPDTMAQRLYTALGAVDDSQYSGLIYIDCSYLTSQSGMTFDFQFGGSNGPTVKVPVDEMVLDNVKAYIAEGLQLPDLPFSDVCSFGLQPSSDYYLLGDTFLRSAYVVYDLTNNECALAQSNFDATDSNVVAISSGATSIPDVTGVASQASVTQTATGLPGAGGGKTSGSTVLPTVTVTAGATGASSSSSSSSTHNAAAGMPGAPGFEALAVAAAASVFALLGGLLVIA